MNNLFNLQGKVAVVTGGSRGIGAMIAQGFIENGVKVYISARKSDEVEAAAKSLNEKGECVPVVADLSTTEGRNALVSAISEEKIDILVNKSNETVSNILMGASRPPHKSPMFFLNRPCFF